MSDFDRAAAREELHALVKERALQFGDFLLASGQRSTYYFDGKQVSLHGRGLYLLARLMLDLMSDWEADAVVGVNRESAFIAGAISSLAAERGGELDVVVVDRESDGREQAPKVEGPLPKGAHVILAQSVVTSGGTALSVIEALRREAEASVVGLVAMVDRLEGAKENLGAVGCEMRSVFSVRDFGIEPPGRRAVIAE